MALSLKRSPLVVLLVALLALPLSGQDHVRPAAPPAQQPADPPRLRLPDGTANRDFIEQARQYLREHGNSAHAPAVAMDLYLFTDAYGDRAAAEQMSRFLVFRYPFSPEARYLVRQIKDATAATRYLWEYQDAEYFQFSKDELRQLSAVGMLMAKVHGAPPQDDLAEALLRLAAINDLLDQRDVLETVRADLRAIEDAPPEMLELADLLSAPERDAVERVVLLHGRDEPVAQRFLLPAYLTHLTLAERDDPRVVRVRLERAMAEGEYDVALPLIETALASAGGDVKAVQRLRLLYGWAWAMTDDPVRARAAFELAADAKEGGGAGGEAGVARAAATLLEAARDQEARRAEAAGALRATVEALRGRPLTAAVVRGQWSLEEGNMLDIYLSMAGSDRLHVDLRRDERPLMMYATDGRSSRLYSPAVGGHRFAAAGLVLKPHLVVRLRPDGKFDANINTDTVPAGRADQLDPLQRLLDQPFLHQDEVWRRMLRQASVLLGPVQRDPDHPRRLTLEMYRLDPDTLALSHATLSLQPLGDAGRDAGQRVHLLVDEGIDLTLDLHTDATVELNPPPTPEVEFAEHEAFDPALFLRVAGEAMGLAVSPLQ